MGHDDDGKRAEHMSIIQKETRNVIKVSAKETYLFGGISKKCSGVRHALGKILQML